MKPIVVKFVVLCAFVLVVGRLNAQQDQSNPTAETQKITEHLYRITTRAAFRTNTIVSVGVDGLLLVDTGPAQTADLFWAEVKKLSDKPVRYVLITHSHADHFGGNTGIEAGTPIVAFAGVREAMTSGANLLAEMPERAIPTVGFQGTMSIRFNGESVSLLPFPGGHGPDDIIVYFPESKVVYLGGLLPKDRFPFINVRLGCSVRNHLDNIDRLLELFPGDITFVSGHGDDLTRDDILRHQKMLRETTVLVEDGLKQGQDAAAMKKAKLLEPWASWGAGFVSTDFWIDTIVRSLAGVTQPPGKSLIDPLYYTLKEHDAAAAIGQYRELKATQAGVYEFSEAPLNLLGYYLLGKGRIEEAIELFNLNVEEYPESFNVYDSLGEGYMALGKKKLAIKNYKKSLAINPDNTNAVQMLERLKGGGGHGG